MHSGIWLGDLARTFAALDPPLREDRRVIAMLLGFELVAPGAPPSPAPAPPTADGAGAADLTDTGEVGEKTESPDPHAPYVPAHVGEDDRDEEDGGHDEDERGEGDDRGDEPSPSAPLAGGHAHDVSQPSNDFETSKPTGPAGGPQIRLLEPARADVRPTVRAWSGPPLARPPDHLPRHRPPHDPLLHPRSSAAIMQLISGQLAPDGNVDEAAVVDQLANCNPIRQLPRLPSMTLRFGVQVLVDTGIGMQLFRRDVEQILEQIRRIAGTGQTSVRYFAHSPLRGAGPGPKSTWTRYRPPSRRTRVIVVSDFGVGGPLVLHQRSTHDEWLLFGNMVSRHGCDLVGMVPYPARMWPPWLESIAKSIVWDRRTTVGQVAARLVRAWHR